MSTWFKILAPLGGTWFPPSYALRALPTFLMLAKMLCIFSYQILLQAYARVSLYVSQYLLYIFCIVSILSQHCLDICFLIWSQTSLSLSAISTQSHCQKLFFPTINHFSSKRSKSWMIEASFHSLLLHGFFFVFSKVWSNVWKEWHLWPQAFGHKYGIFILLCEV